MYTCGLTVYNYAHIGNLRAYIFSDVLKRTLRMNGFRVHHVMNVTDVGHLTSDHDAGDDKIEAAAVKEHASARDIAQRYTDEFLADLVRLNILFPKQMPKATDHIEDQIALIRTLEEKGYTYATSDGVYFDTSKFPAYGALAGGTAGLKEGARVEKNPEKRNPTDFALWKFSKPSDRRQMEWPSPWGTGFPGWHIECSAMSMKYLGETFDIHTGGVDHIPIHHTNEIAQSEASTGKPFVMYWLHNEFLVMGEKKMAKSAGGFIRLQEIIDRGYSPLAFRYLCLLTHYRKPLAFSWDALDAAQKALDALRGSIAMMPSPSEPIPEEHARFMAAINDDLNTPQALGVLWTMLKSGAGGAAKRATLLQFDHVLGLRLAEIHTLVIPKDVRSLVAKREEARKKKDFETSDRLRKDISELGFTVDDTDAGPVIRKQL
jgi:cysteinyl-tRNA synthetase